VNLTKQFQPFLARRGVTRVVQVDQHDVVITLAERRQRRGGRLDCIDLITLPFEQEAKGFKDIALIVGDEDAGRSGRHDAKLSLRKE
jgi:hypothetical protein